MGQCESCVNTSKTSKGQGISYGQGKKRHASGKNKHDVRASSVSSSSRYHSTYGLSRL